MRRLWQIFCVIATLCPATGWAQDSGAEAFAARDFATARALWLDEAAQGSADAMLGLGLLADRGFGQPRDIEAAFDWYQRAADLGLAEAQFNIAIMYDAGIGRPRDADAAQLWYTRAALRDHTRAQYNLGLLLTSGDGLSGKPALAAHWFALAAPNLPAAAEKLRDLPDAKNTLAAPDIIFAQADRQGIELIWDAPAATSPAYLVEALRPPDPEAGYAAPLVAQKTGGTGFLDDTGADALWRVSNLSQDDLDYAPSRWVAPQGVTPPKGRITFIVDPAVDGMAQAAGIFSTQLRRAGYWVRVDDRADNAGDEVYISYSYASDRRFADDVAQYLPSQGQAKPVTQVADAAMPQEILVNLAALR